MANRIMAWRHNHEARFKYNRKPNSQDTIDERKLRSQFAAEKAKLEAMIRNGLGTIRSARSRLDAFPSQAQSDTALVESLAARAQAEVDLQELGVAVPTSTVTLPIPSSPPPTSRPRSPTGQGRTSRSAPHGSNLVGTPTCPSCGSRMVRRTARKGRNRGGQFWGCPRYPACRGTRN